MSGDVNLFPSEVRRPTGELVRHEVAHARFEFGHSLVLPSGYRPVAPRTEEWSLSAELSRFAPQVGPGIEYGVLVATLDREIGAGELVRIELERAPVRIREERFEYSPLGWSCDSLVQRKAPEGEPVLRRSIGFRDGPRVFQVFGEGPEEAYRRAPEEVLHALLSFALDEPMGGALAEELVPVDRDDPFSYSFRHPSTWDLYDSSAGPADRRLMLRDVDQAGVGGYLWVHATGPEGGLSVRELLAAHRADLRSMAVKLGGFVLLPSPETGDWDRVQLFETDAAHGDSRFVAGGVLLEGAGRRLLLAALGPAHSKNPIRWAVNRRAFDIVRDSLLVPGVNPTSGT